MTRFGRTLRAALLGGALVLGTIAIPATVKHTGSGADSVPAIAFGWKDQVAN